MGKMRFALTVFEVMINGWNFHFQVVGLNEQTFGFFVVVVVIVKVHCLILHTDEFAVYCTSLKCNITAVV